MSLPFSIEGKRKFTLLDIADILKVDFLTAYDAARLFKPRIVQRGLRAKYREIDACEIRKVILFWKKYTPWRVVTTIGA